jgi:hypothetical protein
MKGILLAKMLLLISDSAAGKKLIWRNCGNISLGDGLSPFSAGASHCQTKTQLAPSPPDFI